MEHALNCKKGGFTSSRHNEITRLTANLLKEVCIDVKEEPMLQEITGEVFKSKRTKVEKDAPQEVFGRKGKRYFVMQGFLTH